MTTQQLDINKRSDRDAPRYVPDGRRCIHDGCNAWAMMSSDFCYWHNPEIDENEKQRSRSLGGRSSKKVAIWNAPDEVTEISTLEDVKRAYNSLLAWLLQGFISPAQALAAKAIVAGLREAILDEQTLALLGYRERLKNVLGNGGNGHEQLDATNEINERD